VNSQSALLGKPRGSGNIIVPPQGRGDRPAAWTVMLLAWALTVLVLATNVGAVAGEEMRQPQIVPITIDWDSLAPELEALASSSGAQNPSAEEAKSGVAARAIARINLATSDRFANVAASSVPVLLPFDTPAFLRDREETSAVSQAQAPSYFFEFNSIPFLQAGAGGYDAVVVAYAQDMRELGIGFSAPIYIHIGGSAFLYELDEPVGMIEWPAAKLDEFPGLRRIFLEHYVRYTFERYGVPYAIAIECVEGGSRFRKISCRDADKVALRMLKALHFVGGTPQQAPIRHTITIDRPERQSTVFTYHRPGSLIPGTSFRHKGGDADFTVYSNIRFPMADAPAFANSQFFKNVGDCEATGHYNAGMLDGAGAHGCRPGGETLNYSYPWRDNFCETRSFYVGQCPGGLGHQGQDIRPAFCKQRSPGASRCEPYQHDVVAVRDGAVLRAPHQESLYLVVNAPNDRIRFRYLHMRPKQLDAAGMVNGRFLREGEPIGKIGNFLHREGGTTYHLHFDVQVPTKYGWAFVNPYMTLVASYERLIHGRGEQIEDGAAAEIIGGFPPGAIPIPHERPAVPAAKPTETAIESARAQVIDSRMRRNVQRDERSPLTTRMPAGNGRGNDDLEHAGSRARH
jgi:hypothetical protein